MIGALETLRCGWGRRGYNGPIVFKLARKS
jgi:hypothetical protein